MAGGIAWRSGGINGGIGGSVTTASATRGRGGAAAASAAKKTASISSLSRENMGGGVDNRQRENVGGSIIEISILTLRGASETRGALHGALAEGGMAKGEKWLLTRL